MSIRGNSCRSSEELDPLGSVGCRVGCVKVLAGHQVGVLRSTPPETIPFGTDSVASGRPAAWAPPDEHGAASAADSAMLVGRIAVLVGGGSRPRTPCTDTFVSEHDPRHLFEGHAELIRRICRIAVGGPCPSPSTVNRVTVLSGFTWSQSRSAKAGSGVTNWTVPTL